MLVTKQLTVAIHFYSMENNYMEVNGYRQLFGYQHPSNTLFCVKQNKETHTSFKQLEGQKKTDFSLLGELSL